MPAVDAHHIIERKKWNDEGYYLDNGASLCEEHHKMAENDIILPHTLRNYCGIKNIILPSNFNSNNDYTKWGIVLPRKTNKNIKFPSMLYLPFSPSIAGEVGVIKNLLKYPCIITIKMDGSNVKLTNKYVAARNGQQANHKSFDYLKAFHKIICYKIPEHLIVFGEWLYAKHSIRYTKLKNYLQLFAIFDIKNHMWLAWEDVETMANNLGVITVPVIKEVKYDYDYELIKDVTKIGADVIADGHEGLVIRSMFPFHESQFTIRMMKYVRANHVQTDIHWSNKPIIRNEVEK